MAQRYTKSELEHLRASPLVERPARLPPVEEWMGPMPDPAQKKVPNRGKTDESQGHDSNSRRPIFERHISRGSTKAPEDIVLGPPRTAFASAASARNQSRTSSGAQGDETPRADRPSFKDRVARQGPRDDLDTEGSQHIRTGNRRTTNEHESWSGRQSRYPAQEDGERGGRRSGYRDQTRDKDGNPDSRFSRGFDNYRRDATNETNDTHRNGHGRGRNEPSWYRDDKDGDVFEGRKDNNKARDWREKARHNARAADLDWNQHAKPEGDPEWMDEPDVPEKKHAHTQEDFERWKERMKAGNAPAQENAPPTSEQRPNHERSTSGVTSLAGKNALETPLVIDPSIDGFFGQWNEPAKRTPATEGGAAPTKVETTKTKAAKASKFTGFFGPKAPPPTEQETEVQPPPSFAVPADSSSEDKEGFQRILKLLDQQQTSSANNGPQSSPMPASSATQARQQQDASNHQSLVTPRPKNEGPLPQNKDSDFLLNLMRNPRQANSNNSLPPEMLPFSNLVVSPNQTPRFPPGMPPHMVPESTEETPSQDKLNPTPSSDRRRPPPGLINPQPPPPPGPLDSQRYGKDGPEFVPSILSQHVPQQQRQNMLPPPGFHVPPPRTSSHFPPGLMTMQSPNQQDPRGMPYGAMRMGSGNAPPPGMPLPPPGFANAPPPGFAPMHMNQDGANRGFFGGGPPNRPPGEGFGDAGGGGDFGFGQFRGRQE